jgi:transglutaminase-like putative cysteine protease
MTRDDARGTRAIVRTGAAIAAVGVLTTVVVGPHLPGADARAVIPWRAADRDTGSSRVTISPLVSIRTRLVDQANVEVFRVTSPSRSYWRLTALETFDGVIWSSNRRYRRADGRLGSSVSEADKPTHPVEQTFDVTGLDSIWLPAAFRPVSISGTSARYDAESGSLLTDAKSAIGQRYTVSSAVPALDAALLDAAPAVVPSNIAKTYLALPPAFPANVSELARRVVLGATTPYEEARKLQDFFRGGQFTYDLNVPGGHGDDALQRFLFQTRRGYCEQFAGAYAAMARAVGLPSRVGVGFTTGDLQPDGSYSVRGYHGHAWPEVYLAGFGWVAFEPTPGRGIPGGEGYTGVPEAQAAPGAPGTATTLAATTTTTPGAGGTSTVPKLDLGGAVQATGTKAAPSPWPHRLLVATGVLVAVPMLWAVLVWLAVRLRRWRRRRRAGTGGDRVIVAWDEVSETLARSGVAPRRDETPHEYAGRASLAAELDPDLLDGLAGMTTVTRYAPERESAFDDDVVLSAVAVAKQVERTVTRRLDRRTRVRNLVDPRPRR